MDVKFEGLPEADRPIVYALNMADDAERQGTIIDLKALSALLGGLTMLLIALAAARVGVAMGAAGSTVALETCDIALMSDDLGRVPFAVRLSRATSRIIRQNLIASLAIVAFLILATFLGLNIGAVVLIHEGSTLIVVGNALRLLNFERGKEHHGIDHEDRPTA